MRISDWSSDVCSSDLDVAHDHPEPVDRTWWRTRKGQLVLGTGALLVLAFIIATIAPEIAEWAYAAAALLGLVPIARRAVAGARHGTPFNTQTPMSVPPICPSPNGEGTRQADVGRTE